jgi:hypothetical protein
VRIHQADSRHEICRRFTFDDLFAQEFTHHGIEAFHIDGHTPGFTIYNLRGDAVHLRLRLPRRRQLEIQPYGPADRTSPEGAASARFSTGRQLAAVCGYNYVIDYADWWRRFEAGATFAGF